MRVGIQIGTMMALALLPKLVAAEEKTVPGWSVSLGAGAVLSPKFQGAKSTNVTPIPSIDVKYSNIFFVSQSQGIGFNVLRLGGLTVGPLASFDLGRSVSDQRAALHGLHNVPLTIDLGGFARYEFGPYATAQVRLLQGIDGHKGAVAKASFDLNAPPLLNTRLFLSAGPQFAYENRDYAHAFFGITHADSLKSGYKAFSPQNAETAGFGASATYRVTEKITTTAFGDYGRLMGDAAKSPLVTGKYGSRDQFTTGLVFSYHFYP